jgi:thiol-disulfide isomerase/thioredoxin
MLFVLGFGICFAQEKPPKSINFTEFKKVIQKGVVIIEFNAPFNQENGFHSWYKLENCEYYRVCIEGAPQLKAKYKIKSIPTIIMFNNGVKEGTYKANIMLQLPVSFFDLQKEIDGLYLDKF